MLHRGCSTSRSWRSSRRPARSTRSCACSRTCRAGSWASAWFPTSSWKRCWARKGCTRASTCSRSTWRWSRCPATSTRAGRPATATSGWSRTSRRCGWCPWLEKTAMVICDIADEDTGEPVEVAPRQILKRQIARAAEKGFVIKTGSELEFYLFRDAYDDIADGRVPQPPPELHVHHGLPHAADDQGRMDHPADPQRDARRRASRSSSRRASSARASTRSTSRTPTRSQRPTTTRSTSTA